MAVRKLSLRHLRWLAARQTVRHVPGLRKRILMYDRIDSAYDVGDVERVDQNEDLTFTPYEQDLIDQLPRDVTWQTIPDRLERQLALIRLQNKTILGNTGAIVDETRHSLITFRGARSMVTYHDFRPTVLTPVDKPDGIYFNMLGSWKGHRHLFHFLLDRFPRLYHFLTKFPAGKDTVTVLINDDLPGFQKDAYRFMGEAFPNLTFETVPGNERWRIGTLYHLDNYQNTKSTLAEPAQLAFMRQLFIDGYGITNKHAPRRLWVSREDTKKRRIENEMELRQILQRHGFETVMPGRLSFRDQVALFANAQLVAGTHGAGLTNQLFARPDAGLFELFPSNKLRNTYFLLSRSQGQLYRYLIAGPAGKRERYRVDADAFETALAEFVRLGTVS